MPPKIHPSSMSQLSHSSGNSMSFDLQKILESKRAFRRDLAARRIGEKLPQLLDELNSVLAA